ncbi:MAG TPA: hypothetical protein VKT25_05785 [Ktedonobacteraceae bacterium]|nr:hypothetical protein [Ktedonobacteraceae bacterium]
MARRYRKQSGRTSRRAERANNASKISHVSKALWPASLRQSLAIRQATLKHRRLQRLGRWWNWFLGLIESDLVALPAPSPSPRQLKTPMPVASDLVRVLETFDLSQTGIEHFLDAPPEEERHTSEISLDWMKEQSTTVTSL